MSYDEEENIDGQTKSAETAAPPMEIPTGIPTGTTRATAEAVRTVEDAEIIAIRTYWQKQDERQREAPEVADAETAKTDYTL